MNSYVSLNTLGEQVYIEGIPSSYIARLNSNQQNTAINVRLTEAGHLRPNEADLLAGRMAGLMIQQDQNALMNQGYAEIIGPYQIQAYDPNYGQAAVEYLQQPQLNIRSRRNQRGLEDKTQRTVYITSLDQKVTEAQLASYFMDCGEVSDCRVCGDPNSATRFAFIEFAEVEGAERALDRTGAILGSLPLRILPSKTAIVPVKRELMPASQDDMERCSRTVYVTNIDKSVERVDVRGFFEQLCGKVGKLRLLGDHVHSTRIAFIEFNEAQAAVAALNCSGAILGSLPIRVSPSKTPVRSEHLGGPSALNPNFPAQPQSVPSHSSIHPSSQVLRYQVLHPQPLPPFGTDSVSRDSLLGSRGAVGPAVSPRQDTHWWNDGSR